MSVEALSWALNYDAGDPIRKLILIGLANHAKKDGTDAGCSVETLAAYAGCSGRTVQRHLQAMVEDRVLRLGDQRAVAYIRPDRRPVVYDLVAMEARGDTLSPGGERGDTEPIHGVTNMASRGDTAMSPEPKEEPTTKPSPSSRFDEFWNMYPKKVEKQAAKRKWDTTVKRVDPEVILAGLRRYVDFWQRKGTERQFIKGPEVWLNKGCWEDELDEPPARADPRMEWAL